MDGFLSEYDFDFPEELIAKSPASPRDSAGLLVFDRKTGKASFDTFRDLGKYLPPSSLIVLNDTKVVPSRFPVLKPEGGRAVLTAVDISDDSIKVMSDRKLDVGATVSVSSGDIFKIIRQEGKYFFIHPGNKFKKDGVIDRSLIFKLFEDIGVPPIPPYIKKCPLKGDELKEEYQSVFACNDGSYAAPTASLHFTEELLTNLRSEGHETCFVTLHVGLGTFAPLTEENIASGKLHKEVCEINDETAEKISRARKEGRKIIAVGTTAVRTLESFSDDGGMITAGKRETDLFIREGYEFKIADGLITNFHVPRSSLLMLVSAFAGRKEVRELYAAAIDRKFRLFSFGDAMLIV
jgi:S-adenosylmethionine:tRNA ribosyltransferase-isomerase